MTIRKHDAETLARAVYDVAAKYKLKIAAASRVVAKTHNTTAANARSMYYRRGMHKLRELH